MKTATTKFSRQDHEDMRYLKRAAHPVKSKREYNRNDKSWRKEF